MPEIQLTTKKGFLDGHVYAKRGSTITADEFRAAELHRLGLVEDYGEKAAAEPENKKAPEPKNKAAGKTNPPKT
ncbi:hypothetical protein HU749_006905 [Pseudomonas ogarae]|uniref:hypothetical protein n=1 Tax=Pseudomonas ogarae (strain DSM 112162 / CECT 30235 / F113) TaxID=1114970 RepID=UPI0016484B2D|nr:hypothetical protein [Pseudomonas zarinae]QXH96110.1 hypothetical protein HU749_006905 [Pseudomonas zarinae]